MEDNNIIHPLPHESTSEPKEETVISEGTVLQQPLSQSPTDLGSHSQLGVTHQIEQTHHQHHQTLDVHNSVDPSMHNVHSSVPGEVKNINLSQGLISTSSEGVPDLESPSKRRGRPPRPCKQHNVIACDTCRKNKDKEKQRRYRARKKQQVQGAENPVDPMKTDYIPMAALVPTQNGEEGTVDHAAMAFVGVTDANGAIVEPKTEGLATGGQSAMIIISEEDLANTLRSVLSAFKIKPDTSTLMINGVLNTIRYSQRAPTTQ